MAVLFVRLACIQQGLDACSAAVVCGLQQLLSLLLLLLGQGLRTSGACW